MNLVACGGLKRNQLASSEVVQKFKIGLVYSFVTCVSLNTCAYVYGFAILVVENVKRGYEDR